MTGDAVAMFSFYPFVVLVCFTFVYMCRQLRRRDLFRTKIAYLFAFLLRQILK